MAEKNRILIHIEGGIVQDIFCDNPDKVDVTVRDMDIDKSCEKDLAADGSLFEDNRGHRYCEYEAIQQKWSHLETQPFENPVSVEALGVKAQNEK